MNSNKSNGNSNGNSMKNMKGGAAAAPAAEQQVRPPGVNRTNIPVPEEYERGISYNFVRAQDNPALLRIINEGIDDIVGQLKKKLGNNFQDTNINAKLIMEHLTGLQTAINADVATIIDGPDPISLRQNNVGEYVATHQPVYYEHVVGNSSADAKRKTVDQNFEQINSPNVERFVNTQNLRDITIEFDRTEIEKRLRNCQNLEVLYLIKHEELLTTFAFALNLFDKYKYAVKVILFLLKNLASTENNNNRSDNSSDNENVYITMPPPLIKNISKLVADQKKVQGIITKMKETIFEGKQKFGDGVAVDNLNANRLRGLIKTEHQPGQQPIQPSESMNQNLVQQ